MVGSRSSGYLGVTAGGSIKLVVVVVSYSRQYSVIISSPAVYMEGFVFVFGVVVVVGVGCDGAGVVVVGGGGDGAGVVVVGAGVVVVCGAGGDGVGVVVGEDAMILRDVLANIHNR